MEATGSQQQQKKGKKGRKAAAPGPNPCLGCQKNCTRAQHSVRCTLCELWCHRSCAGLSEEAFRGLEIQQKETGTAFWACRSCLGYAKKVNNQFKKLEERLDSTDGRVEANTNAIKETRQQTQSTAAEVKTLTDRLDRMADEMEEKMDSELREREIRRHNLIIHGLAEVSENINGNRERMEADKRNCEDVFRALGARTGSSNMRFCRRIGERGHSSRPLVVGLNSESDKNFILSRAKKLLNTDFQDVTIVPDLTKRQRTGEADKRNRQLTQQDISNNMKWLVVGRRGEKRLIKGVEREFTQRPPPATYSQYPQIDSRNRDRPSGFRPGTGQVQAAGPQNGQYAPGPVPQRSGGDLTQATGPQNSQYATGPHPQWSGASQVQAAGPQQILQAPSQSTGQAQIHGHQSFQQPYPGQPISYAPQARPSQVQVAGSQTSQYQYMQNFPLLNQGQVQVAGQQAQYGGQGQVQVAGPQAQYSGPHQENRHAREMDMQERCVTRSGEEMGPEQNGRGPHGPPPYQRGRLNSKRPLDQEEEMDGGHLNRRQRQ